MAIVNATAFSGIGGDGTSPLDAGDVPVFQMMLARHDVKTGKGRTRAFPSRSCHACGSSRSSGRLSGGVGSFNNLQARSRLEFSHFAHQGDPERIKALVDRVAAHVALQTKPYNQRTTALVLSTYPSKEWNMAHAVGLDALASQALLADILADGHAIRC